MPDNTVGQIALELTLNKAGYEKDLSGVLGSARNAGDSLARIFQTSSRAAGNSVTKAINGVTNQISGMTRKITGLVATAFSVRQIVSFSKACIELGSDLAEVQNVVDVTFGSSAKTINEFAKTATSSFGLSELSAKRYSSTVGAMFKSMGLASNQVTEMSQKIAELSGDMASFYNLDTDEAFAKIRAGISGETEPLKQLGINLSVANLEAYRLSQGMTTAYNKMSQADQALVRYNYLLQVTADAQGDFARTSNSWANQVRVLQLSFESLKATIGQGLINALLPVIQVINAILAKLQRLATAFKNFTSFIFGNAGSGSAAGSTASAMSSIADSIGNASTGASGLADGLQDTASAAKAALKYLAPFDELNVMNTNPVSDSGSGSGAGALGDLAGLLEDAGTDFAGSLADALDELDPSEFTEAVKRAIERGDWYGVGALFGQKLNGVIRQWDAYGDGFTLGEKIKNVLQALNGFLETFSFYDLGAKVGDWIGGMMDGVTPEELATTIANLFNAAVSGRTGLIDKLNERNVPAKIGQALGTAFANFDYSGLANLAKKFLTGVVSMVNSAAGSFVDNGGPGKLEDAAEELGKAIGESFAMVNWDDITTIGTSIFTGLIKMFGGAISSFVDNGGPEKLKGSLGTIGTAIGEAFANIKGKDLAAIINSISEGLLSMFKNAINAFTKGDGWKSLWDGLKELSLSSWGLLALPVTLKLVSGAISGLVSAVTTGIGVKLAAGAAGGSAAAGAAGAAGTASVLSVGGPILLGIAATIATVATTVETIKNINEGKTGWSKPGNTTYTEFPDGTQSRIPIPEYLYKQLQNDPRATEEYKNKLLEDILGRVEDIYHLGLGSDEDETEERLSNKSSGLKGIWDPFGTGKGIGYPGGIGTGKSSPFPGSSGGSKVWGNSAPYVLNAMVNPFKGSIVQIEKLIEASKIPDKTEEMAKKAEGRIDGVISTSKIPKLFGEEATRSITEFGSKDFAGTASRLVTSMKSRITGIPEKFGEEATRSLTEFGNKDYAGTGTRATEKLKNAITGIAAKFGAEGQGGINEFLTKDYTGGGRAAGTSLISGLTGAGFVGTVAALTQNALNAFLGANWAGVGAAGGATLGQHFKANFVSNAKSTLMLQTAAGKPITQAYVVPYANGGYVQGGLFLAGEVPGQPEMVGNINGKTGVASGQEITGIGEAIRETSAEEIQLLRQQNQYLQALLMKDPFGAPNSAAGRWIAQSQNAYKAVTG